MKDSQQLDRNIFCPEKTSVHSIVYKNLFAEYSLSLNSDIVEKKNELDLRVSVYEAEPFANLSVSVQRDRSARHNFSLVLLNRSLFGHWLFFYFVVKPLYTTNGKRNRNQRAALARSEVRQRVSFIDVDCSFTWAGMSCYRREVLHQLIGITFNIITCLYLAYLRLTLFTLWNWLENKCLISKSWLKHAYNLLRMFFRKFLQENLELTVRNVRDFLNGCFYRYDILRSTVTAARSQQDAVGSLSNIESSTVDVKPTALLCGTSTTPEFTAVSLFWHPWIILCLLIVFQEEQEHYVKSECADDAVEERDESDPKSSERIIPVREDRLLSLFRFCPKCGTQINGSKRRIVLSEVSPSPVVHYVCNGCGGEQCWYGTWYCCQNC